MAPTDSIMLLALLPADRSQVRTRIVVPTNRHTALQCTHARRIEEGAFLTSSPSVCPFCAGAPTRLNQITAVGRSPLAFGNGWMVSRAGGSSELVQYTASSFVARNGQILFWMIQVKKK